MSKKDNFSQAMFEMFGLGKAPEEGEEELDELRQQLEDFEAEDPAGPEFDPAPLAADAAKQAAQPAEPFFSAPAPAAQVPRQEPLSEASSRPAPVKRANCTYFAEGTSMEGTLRSDSDVEICGDFKGEIAADGKVTLHANTTSSIAAAELELVDCRLIGDSMVSGDVTINEGSSVAGNIRAENVVCSGMIKGNLNVSGNITLEENAQILGDIRTNTLAISRGAKISGKVDMGAE